MFCVNAVVQFIHLVRLCFEQMHHMRRERVQIRHTHSLRHCDLVQLHGFRGLGVVSAVDMLRANEKS